MLVFIRLWVVMCPHKREERFWGIKTSSAKGWMVQVKGEGWRVALKEPGPSNTFSLCLSSPKGLTHFRFLCFRVLLDWESCSEPCSQHRDQCPTTLHGTLLWVPPSASLTLCKPLTYCCWDIFCHIRPRLEQFCSCLASGEEQAPTMRIINALC